MTESERTIDPLDSANNSDVSKFVRKHKRALGIGGTVAALSLVAGLYFTQKGEDNITQLPNNPTADQIATNNGYIQDIQIGQDIFMGDLAVLDIGAVAGVVLLLKRKERAPQPPLPIAEEMQE